MKLIIIALFLFICCGIPCVEAREKSSSDPELLIVFLFVGALIGALTTHFLSRYAPGVPYTVIVFVEGVILAAIADNTAAGNFKDSINAWADIDAELILFVFLPVLIFGEAMSLKWYIN
jgi:hypothetical protein